MIQSIKYGFILILTQFTYCVFSQNINIALYFDNALYSVVVTPAEGSYVIIADSVNYIKVNNSDAISLTMSGDSVSVRSIEKELGTFKKIQFKGIDKVNSFKIKPSKPALELRQYNDNLDISVMYRKLLVVNNVNTENYIAGVVETEGGSKAQSEYYKTQAILCRTYAYENMEKHIFEGFNLCDGVHCQAYKGKCKLNPEILNATKETSGLVIADTSGTLITAAFHSNCGGMTENSGNVWVKPIPYLISVKDTYCTSQRNATWEISVPKEKWINYLNKYGAKIPESSEASMFQWEQNSRLKYYKFETISIPLKDIRYDWKFRSSYFSIYPDGENLKFKGKGYGHGVGLCQEGAMKMAQNGLEYKKIINFYYANVLITNIDSLQNLPPANIQLQKKDSIK